MRLKGDLTGRVLKVLRDGVAGIDCVKGSYLTIVKENSYDLEVKNKRSNNWALYRERNSEEIQLMEEGFENPDFPKDYRGNTSPQPSSSSSSSSSNSKDTLKEGDMVLLKNRRGSTWNTGGKMDQYMGKTLKVYNINSSSFSIVGNDWRFSYDDIEKIISEEVLSEKIPDRSSLIKEARSRYCIGNTIRCAKSNSEFNLKSLDLDSGAVLSNVGSPFYVYYEGKWGEVISKRYISEPKNPKSRFKFVKGQEVMISESYLKAAPEKTFISVDEGMRKGLVIEVDYDTVLDIPYRVEWEVFEGETLYRTWQFKEKDLAPYENRINIGHAHKTEEASDMNHVSYRKMRETHLDMMKMHLSEITHPAHLDSMTSRLCGLGMDPIGRNPTGQDSKSITTEDGEFQAPVTIKSKRKKKRSLTTVNTNYKN